MVIKNVLKIMFKKKRYWAAQAIEARFFTKYKYQKPFEADFVPCSPQSVAPLQETLKRNNPTKGGERTSKTHTKTAI